MRFASYCLVHLVIAVAVMLASPNSARADAREEARALLKEGNDLLTDGRYVEALERFRAAYARYASPKLLLNIGTALRQLGKNAEAMEAYERYLADAAAEPDKKAEVQALLAEMEAKIARLEIGVNESRARVTLDGKSIAVSGRHRVDPGSHVVVAELAGRRPAIARFELRAGETRRVDLKLTAGERAPVERRDPPDTTAQRISGWVVLGVGVAGLAVGGITAALVGTQKADLAARGCDETACPSAFADEVDTYNRLRITSTAGFIIGGVAAATGSILLITAAVSSSETARIDVRVGTRGADIRATF